MVSALNHRLTNPLIVGLTDSLIVRVIDLSIHWLNHLLNDGFIKRMIDKMID